MPYFWIYHSGNTNFKKRRSWCMTLSIWLIQWCSLLSSMVHKENVHNNLYFCEIILVPAICDLGFLFCAILLFPSVNWTESLRIMPCVSQLYPSFLAQVHEFLSKHSSGLGAEGKGVGKSAFLQRCLSWWQGREREREEKRGIKVYLNILLEIRDANYVWVLKR